MKKKLSYFLVICVILATVLLPVRADEKVETGEMETEEIKIYSEYEAIVEARQLSENELAVTGYSKEEIQVLKSDAPEKELLYRKTKSDEILRNGYGYTDKQIAILRAYNGEPLEDYPQIAAATATLSISNPQVGNASGTDVYLFYTWQWSCAPLVMLEDAVVVMWDGTHGTQEGNVRLNTTKSFFMAQYYHTDDVSHVTNTKYTFSTDVIYHAASIEFVANKGLGTYARKGNASLYFEITESSAQLTSLDVMFTYLHMSVGLAPSFSLGSGFDISVGAGTDKADSVYGYVNISNGKWTNLN